MELENCLDRKKFEGTTQITHDLTFKDENGDVFEIKKEKVAVNDYDREEFGVAQITRVFIKDEYDQSISMEDADTVSDRTYNAHDTKANFNHVFVTSERVFKIEDSKIEVQKDTDNKYKITETSDLMTIKNEEDDVQRFTNENKKVVSDWTANENESLKSWIKCEAVEELKLENDLDSETFGITGITEEYIIKNEDDQILEHPMAESGCRPNVCIHCNATFRYKRTLDNHIINKHPEYIASVSSKIHECKYCVYKTTFTDRLAIHMGKHPGAEGGCEVKICIHCNTTFKCKKGIDDHIIKKHPEYIATISRKIYECKYCEFKTALKSHLVSHLGKHPGAEGGYERKTCIHCNATFKYKTNLDDHIIGKHPECITSVSSKILECKYCAFKTTLKDRLARHMGKHPGAEGGCELKTCIHCNTTFTSKKGLDDHIIKKHPEYIASVSSKIHECKYCVFKTALKSHLVNHMGKHPGAEGGCERKMCTHCNATFTSKTNLNNHIIKKHPECISSLSNRIHECKYCLFKTAKKIHLAKHMMRYHGAEEGDCVFKTTLKDCHMEKHPGETCIHCNAKFTCKKGLNDHIIKKHPEYISTVSSKIHECEYCVFKTALKSHLVRHMRNHSKAEGSCERKTCIHCNATFQCKKGIDDHIIKKHPEYIASITSKIHECKYCIFKTTSKFDLARHMGKHAGAEADCELKTCNHCNARFKSKNGLENHILKQHPEYISSVSSKIHECKYCVFKTTSKFHLDSHMGKHPEAKCGRELKTCTHCNAKFKYKKGLDDHTIKKHPEYAALVSSKIHECKYCGFKTALKSHLVSHMGKHSGSEAACNLKTCIHCNTTFKNKTTLDNHIIEKHPEYISSVTSKMHECKHCVFKTTLKDRLAMHMGKHPGADGGCERKTCIHCNAKFTCKKSLHDHTVKKHPEYIASVSSKIHECKYCEFKTALKSHFNSHMRKHPGVEGECELKTCIHCNATFTCNKNLDDHTIKKHPEYIASVSSKIHECKYCIFKTTSKDHFTRHMGKHSVSMI